MEMISHEDNLRYYREYNRRNKEARKAYRQRTKEHKQEYLAEYYKKNLDEKRFYCDTCDISCRTNSELENHLKTKKHILGKQKIEYDIFKNAPSLPTLKDFTQVSRSRGISWKVIKGCKKIQLAQLLNIPLIMNPNY